MPTDANTHTHTHSIASNFWTQSFEHKTCIVDTQQIQRRQQILVSWHERHCSLLKPSAPSHPTPFHLSRPTTAKARTLYTHLTTLYTKIARNPFDHNFP